MHWRLGLSLGLASMLSLPTDAWTVPFAREDVINLPSPHASTLRTSPTLSPFTGSNLQAREAKSLQVHHLPSGWTLHIQRCSLYIPLAIAASALTESYQDVMDYAAHAADSFAEELMEFAVRVGQVVLSFIAKEALIPVSWDLVHDFASVMKTLTERGLVGSIDAVLKSGVGRVIVRVDTVN